MVTDNQISKVFEAIKLYKRRYIKKQFDDLDESATRIMINFFLTDVLGYVELDEIKTEYTIRGEYADYVIQLKRKKQFVVEVKSTQLDLSERHLRQSLSYAANEGIDWIILTNGRSFQFYRVIFEKPMRTEILLSIDFNNASQSDMKKYAEKLAVFTKKSVEKDEHERYWQRSVALSPDNVVKLLYSENIVKLLKRELRKTSGINFDEDTIKEALRNALGRSVVIETLRYKKDCVKTRNNIKDSAPQSTVEK